MNIEQIKRLVFQREYRVTLHAEIERDADQITLQENRLLVPSTAGRR